MYVIIMAPTTRRTPAASSSTVSNNTPIRSVKELICTKRENAGIIYRDSRQVQELLDDKEEGNIPLSIKAQLAALQQENKLLEKKKQLTALKWQNKQLKADIRNPLPANVTTPANLAPIPAIPLRTGLKPEKLTIYIGKNIYK